MIDLLHLPEPDERVVWFPGQGVSSATSGWRVWNKPRGVSMVAMLAIGSGCGGGGGAGNSSGSSAGGGGGGAGGSLVKMMFPAWVLPDKLYVLSRSGGQGGDGGSSGNNGGTAPVGATSIVSIWPTPSATGNYIVNTSSTASGGFGGQLGGGGSSGSPSTPVASSSPLGQMAISQLFIAGGASATGSTGAASNIFPSSSIALGGGGGGGKTTGGGGVGSGYNSPFLGDSLLRPVPGGTADTGADASSGFIHAGIHYGGCGGGGNNLGVGGRGGNGVAWGAGGGGGGGGLTGGRGGDGGPGLVIIASW